MKNLKDKKIYIAGHNGMVGSACKRILERSGYKNLIFKSSSELDLKDYSSVEDFINEEKPYAIINAAAKVGGILANDTYQYEFLSDNLLIQNNLINNSHFFNVSKFIFLGSSCIYPKFSKQPIKESYLLTDSLEPTNQWYAIAKIAGVKLIESLRNQYNKNYVSLMPTNLYGPNDNFDPKTSHVIPGLIQKFHKSKLKNNKYLRVWGSGRPLREFLHVDDLSDAIVFLMKKVNAYEVYDKKISQINIGSGDEISIKNLAYILKDIVGYKGQIVFDESMPDGTPRKLLDCSFLKEKGWVSSTPLDSGLNDLYEFYKKKIENRQSK